MADPTSEISEAESKLKKTISFQEDSIPARTIELPAVLKHNLSEWFSSWKWTYLDR